MKECLCGRFPPLNQNWSEINQTIRSIAIFMEWIQNNVHVAWRDEQCSLMNNVNVNYGLNLSILTFSELDTTIKCPIHFLLFIF